MTATASLSSNWTVVLTTDSTKPGQWFRAQYANEGDVLISSASPAVDRWCPLNTPTVWIWADEDGPQVTNTITIESEYPILGSTVTPEAHAVIVHNHRPLTWRANSVPHFVLGRNDPVVTILPAQFPTGTLTLLLTGNWSERFELVSLLMAGAPLVLRSTCPDRVDTLSLLPMSWRDPFLGDAKSGQGLLEIEYQAVTSTPSKYYQPPVWAWEDLVANHATWGDVEDAYTTWGEAEIGPVP